ncbi:MAG: iron chelate uptake ABC transporter family permease subunit [Micropruina sp.]
MSRLRLAGWFAGLALLLSVIAASLALGAKEIPPPVVLDALRDFDAELADHLIVQTIRMPRTVVGLIVGVALGIAGAVMQGLTRNPLADPGILGVEAGASLAVVVGIYVFGVGNLSGYVWFAFLGAGVASVAVYALGSLGGGATPVKLALAGAALTAGPIGFVGLTVPHLARLLTGPDNRWVLAYSALLGPILLVGADVVGRLVLRPAELEVGIVTALIGAPWFVLLVRRAKVAQL